MFFGEKLESVRNLQGFSRKEIATRLAVSEQTIWQYENGYIEPKFETINQLKDIFDVTPQFFYSKEFVTEVSDINYIAYRADDRKYRKKANTETEYIDYVNHFLKVFENCLNKKSLKIDQLRELSEKMMYVNSRSLEEIAELAREYLNVSKNQELLYKLEIAGITILEKNMGNNVDAYSTWTSDNRPIIILGSVRKSSVRRNFDLAHELGHLLLHSKIKMDELTKDEYRKIEQEANAFASFFLLPEEEFVHDFSKLKKKSNPNSYLAMKLKYHVSIIALEYRAYKLGLLTFEENRYFYASLNRLGMRQVEPYDDELPIIKPGKIRALFDMVLKNNLLYLNDLVYEYHVKPSFLENIFNLETDFFDKYELDTTEKYYESNVIDIFPKGSN